jgi:hypothetical protein
MEVAMIRFISKVKAGLLILLAVLSILIGSSTLFGKKSYADVPTWAHTDMLPGSYPLLWSRSFSLLSYTATVIKIIGGLFVPAMFKK